MTIVYPKDFSIDLKQQILQLLGIMHPLNQGPCWSLVYRNEPGEFWIGVRRDLLTGSVLTLRSTFWCFGFDERTPFSSSPKLVDRTTISYRNGYKHDLRLISKACFGFVYENLITTIREEVQVDWT